MTCFYEITCNEGKAYIKLESEAWSIRLSYNGFWCTFRKGDRFFRRCIDGSVVEGSQVLRNCSDQEIQEILVDVHEKLNKYAKQTVAPYWLLMALNRTADVYQKQQKLFQLIYPEGVPILPPDRYRDLVVHPAYGCPNRKCTFCIFYRDKPFSPLSADAFCEHWKQLGKFWGPELYQRDGLFLGSANALALSQRRLVEKLEFLQRQPLLLKRGIAAFLDSDYAPVRTVAEWQKLYQLGLRHLVVGLETGWSELRSELGKNHSLMRIRQDTERAGIAEITSGLTVLVGSAGKQRSEQHVIQTCEFIGSLPLQRQDRIYLSIIEWPNGISVEKSDGQQWVQQELESFKVRLKSETTARVSAYPVSGYRYFA